MNRLYLLLDFLNGRGDSQAILADIIDEERDPYLAERVRSRKQSDRKHLQLALEVIPFEMGVEVGIDFFSHAISFGHEVPELDSQLSHAKRWIRNAADGNLADMAAGDAPDAARAGGFAGFGADALLSPRISGRYQLTDLDHAFLCLVEVIDVAGLIFAAERADDHRRTRRSLNRLRTALMKVANHSRLTPVQLTRLLRPEELRPYRRLVELNSVGQMDWQWQHLIGVVEAAVDRESQ